MCLCRWVLSCYEMRSTTRCAVVVEVVHKVAAMLAAALALRIEMDGACMHWRLIL